MGKYKTCIVPFCKSTEFATPNKLFIHVPKDVSMRKKWIKSINRRDAISEKTVAYCCQDHFDLPNDIQNFMEYSMMGTRYILKKGTLPRFFDCQMARNLAHVTQPRPSTVTRERRRLTSDILSVDVGSPETMEIAEASDTPILEPLIFCDVDYDAERSTPKTRSVGTQTQKVGCRSKHSQSPKLFVKSAACSPLKPRINEIATSPLKEIQLTPIKRRKTTTSPISRCEFTPNKRQKSSVCEVDDSDSDFREFSDNCSDDDDDTENFDARVSHYPSTEKKMLNKPEAYLGVPKKSLFLIDLLCKYTKASKRDILLVLTKIRLNRSFYLLEDDFDLSRQQLGRIFRKNVKSISKLLKTFVVFPEEKLIARNLPIPFRARYADVTAIVDCLEIEIPKPSSAIEQSLTWSEYKKANTLKYLVSCTPDGTCSFVSKGYGGRATDSDILKDCGIRDKMKRGKRMMTDRGFKYVESYLAEKGIKLVRPPSLKVGKKFTKSMAKATKQVAALRIHIERVIGRLRNFAMISKHAAISRSLTPFTDDIMTIAGGLINFQSPIIRK